MCYFITMLIPKSKSDFLKTISVPRDFHINETSNTRVEVKSSVDTASYSITSGGCSCDLFQESAKADKSELHIEKLIKKYKKRGWSESKIKKAVSQSLNSSAASGVTAGLRDDLKYFLSYLVSYTNEIKLIIRWLGSPNKDAHATPKIGPSMNQYELRAQNIITENNVLYTIKK